MTSIGQKLLLLPAFLLTLGGPGLAAATTYFVDAVNGTAGGDGSAGSPWQTITQAMTSGTLIAGDTVTVASGTYDAALGEVFPIGFVDGVSLSGPGDGSASV
ncbi:MAG: DUF1565 domain-containing protein, partial [bacterium]|nr:DUF1565 domain-containing protein [bacterium]